MLKRGSQVRRSASIASHFMTCSVLQWIPIFTRPETVNIMLDSFRYLMNDSFQLYVYVILENHFHLIARSEQLDKDMARFKFYTAENLF